ncbi:MAG: hypothetical protein HY929_02270 [Euryarchaeota archaeon]|nr:hypothetical protein [Euryarchaeota archaeon]
MVHVRKRTIIIIALAAVIVSVVIYFYLEKSILAPKTAPTTTAPIFQPVTVPLGPVAESTIEEWVNKNPFFFKGLEKGAIIELHIAKSAGEVFVLEMVDNTVSVRAGTTTNKDIELWIDRDGFTLLLGSTDARAAAKQLYQTGSITYKKIASILTLYRKGYFGWAKNNGFV